MEGQRSFRDQIRDADSFFNREGKVWQTLDKLTARLREEGIDYAIIGAIAMVIHGYERLTVDVDVLITRDGLERFRQRIVGRGFVPKFRGAMKSYRDTETNTKVDFILEGEYPGDGKPKPVQFPDPTLARIERDGRWLITPEKLVELKLASGMSASDRLKDLGDVLEFIISLKLPREFAEKLDPSVRAEYLRLWEAAQTRRPDE